MVKRDIDTMLAKARQGNSNEKTALAERAPNLQANRLDLAEKLEASHPNGLGGAAIIPIGSTVGAENLQVGQTIDAPLANVHDNPQNARVTYETGEIEELAQSLKEKGQLVPAPAIPIKGKPGHYMLIDGKRRRTGLAYAGMPTMRLVISEDISDDPKEMYVRSFRINNERSPQAAIDNAIRWRSLLADGVFANQEQIVSELKVSRAVVSKTLAMANLDEAVIERMRVNPEKFGTYVGYEITLLAGMMPPDQLLQLVERVVTENLSSRQLEDIRASIITTSKKPRKEKEQSRQYRAIPSADRPYAGMIREFDSGRIAMDIANIEPDKRARVLEFLRSEFGC